MASPTWWTWVWVNSRRWWGTGRPGVLRFIGPQRVEHDWATELIIKIAERNINKFRYSDDNTLKAEREVKLKSLLMRLYEESEKAGNIPENENHAIWFHHFMQIDGGKVGTVINFLFLDSKSLWMLTATMKLEDIYFLKRNLDSVFKSILFTLLTDIHIVKAMVFPVVMYECEYWMGVSECCKNWSIWIHVLEKTFECPLDSKEKKPVSLKGNQPWILIES